MNFTRISLLILLLATIFAAGWWYLRMGPSSPFRPSPPSQDEPNAAEKPIAHADPAKALPAQVHALPDTPATPPAGTMTGKELEARVSAPDPSGRFQRARVMQTDFKYPLVLVEETIDRDPATGAERVAKREEMVADHILVKLHPHATPEQLEALAQKHGGKIRKKMYAPGLYLVELSRHDTDAVRNAIDVFSKEATLIAYAEPDYIVHALDTTPNDSQFSALWGMNNTGQTGGTPDADIDAPAAWDITTGNHSILVGVIDTGLDYNHPDLAANAWTNPGETPNDGIDNDNNGFIDDYRGWDFINDDNDPFDDNNHGTHCSGTIGGVGNNAVGVAGVNWSVSIVAFKFLSSAGSGSTADAVDAIYYGTRIGVKLTSNSWGGGGFSQSLFDAIEDAHAHGILFVAAAGNSASDNDVTPSYPASYTNANILAVAATDHNDAMAGFSSYGLTTVDLGAPGVSILSTTPNNTYSTFSGTSMATPHVAGVSALLWSLNPSTPHLVIREAVLNGTDPIPALAGKTVTGGRLNAAGALAQLGMLVAGSSPADGEVVFSLPTDFAIDFSDAYSNSTVAAGDLAVNGVAASSVTLTDSNSVTFHYTTSPVTNEGLQTLFIAEDAVLRMSDGDGVREWTAHFRYDTLALAVTSTVPPSGSTVLLPFTNLLAHFNEPLDPGSAAAGDLQINQGAVTQVSSAGSSALLYTLSGIEQEGTLTVNLPAGTLTDPYGNPNVAFAGSFELDVGTVPYPLPLKAKNPLGSLVYDPTVSAFVAPPGDSDNFMLPLDGNQTLAVSLLPATGLQARIELYDPASNLIAGVSASAPGQETLLQATTVSMPGTYTVSISGLSGTSGGYTLNVLLNALLEVEAHGGASNDTLAAAQSLDGGLITLTGAVARSAALGDLKGASNIIVYAQNFESGLQGYTISNAFGTGGGLWHLSSGRGLDSGHSSTQSVYYGQNEGPGGGGNYDTTVANGGAFYSPTINLPNEPSLTLNFNFFLETEGSPSWDVAQVEVDDGSGFVPLLSSSSGSLPTGTEGAWATVSADLSDFSGKSIVLQFSFDTLDGVLNDFEGWYVDDITITTPVLVDDWFCFTNSAGAFSSLVLKQLSSGFASLDLYDGSGTLLAAGNENAENVDRSIDYLLSASTTSYYARVRGFGADYSLVLTRNAAFDLEANDTQDEAQDLADRNTVLGAIKAKGDLFCIDWMDPTPTDILTLDPETAAILNAFDSPVTPTANPFGFNAAFDGVNLWYNDGAFFGDNGIYKLNPDDGAELDSFTPGVPLLQGLGWLDGEIYATDANLLYAFDDTTFSLTRTLSPAWDGAITGLAGDSGRGVIWAVSQLNVIYQIDPITGDILTSGPDSNIGFEQGMAVVGDELFISEANGAGLNDIAVYNADTLALVRRMPVAVQGLISGLGGDGIGGTAEDWFRFNARTGDSLIIKTLTPAGDPQQPFEFHNNLDPVLELLDPSGLLVASNNNGGADGKNAELNYTALSNGNYAVRLYGADESEGEYILDIQGATGSNSPFRVSATQPTDGASLSNAPTQFVVDFNDTVLLTSLTANDLLIDASPATNVVVVDGNTVAFGLPPLGGGTYSASISGGAILDLQGTLLDAFTSQFTIDVIPPRIIDSSIQFGDIISSSNLTVTIEFDEELASAGIDAGDFLLAGELSGPVSPSSFNYVPATSILTLDYSGLQDDRYTLTLRSGDGALEDLTGNDLDGEALTFPIPPNTSGNGAAGGDFVVSFFIDYAVRPYPTPLEAKDPPGSLIYDPSVSTYIASPADTDSFTLMVDGGQRITLVITPLSGLQAYATLAGPGGVIASGQTATASADLVLQSVSAALMGTYTFLVGSVSNTAGACSAQLILNAAAEEEMFGGPSNNSPAAAQSVETSFLNIGSSAARGAVAGAADGTAAVCVGPDGFGYRACAAPFAFEDISANGTPVLTGVDDAFFALPPESLMGFYFQFYGFPRTNVFITSNGTITFNQGDSNYQNSDLSATPNPATIAAFWDDLVISGGTNSAVYWGIRGEGDFQRLVVQWNQIIFYSALTNGTITFQAVLSEADNSIQFNYLDLNSAHPGSQGGSASVGIKESGNQGSYRMLLGFNNGPNTLVGTGRSVLLSPSLSNETGIDYYSFNATAGDPLSLVLAGARGAVNLYDVSGALLAAGATGPANLDSQISGFVSPVSGTLYAGVTGEAGENYTLTVLRQAAFDAETNNTLAVAQKLYGFATVLGALPDDPLPADSADVYSLEAATGNTINVSTRTPGDGPGEFENILDPVLILYAPNGAQVAVDDNGAADGRNAQITHLSTTSGTFKVRITDADLNPGEYVLDAGLAGGTPLLSFATPVFNGAEKKSNAVITVVRNGDTGNVVSVQYQTGDGTAGAGVDYTSSSGTLSFTQGVKQISFNVPLINDAISEGPETVLLTLSNATGGAQLGSPGAATLNILDDEPAPLAFASATPAISADPADTQNNLGDRFDLSTNGGFATTINQGGFGNFGRIYFNYDGTNVYVGGTGADMAGDNHAQVIFLSFGSLTNNAGNLWSKSGLPQGLDFLHNAGFDPPVDLAILLGDEYGDGTYPNFNLGSGYDFGQGIFLLGPTSFVPVAGTGLSQFDGLNSDPTSSGDDDGNRRMERWEAVIPLSSLSATTIQAVTSCYVSGLFASDGVSGVDRYLSGNFLGLAADGNLDSFHNFGFTNFVVLHGLPVTLPPPPPPNTGDVIWVNEIHYDNTGTDTGEGVEIAGQAGLNLTGFSIVLYNGIDGTVYNTSNLTGIVDNEGCGFGALWFAYPVNGLQNGDPDGLALVRNNTNVIQFLSYDGDFVAVNGPAAGLPSVDVSAGEPSSTPVGFSLQCRGTGNKAIQFLWDGPFNASPGSLNTGQFIDPCVSNGDMDNDRLPDAWETQYFGGPTNATAGHDFDGDGESNLEEFLSDTGPTNGLSFFTIEDLTKHSAGQVYFDSSTARTYSLHFRTSLLSGTPWILITNATTGTGGLMSLSDTNDGTLRFYRIDVKLPPAP